MMYNIKHAITAVVFLFSSGAPLCAYNEVGYNNLSDAENTSGWGTSKKENYYYCPLNHIRVSPTS